MKICFPIMQNDGLSSVVNAHFGSAKDMLIYDTDSGSFEVISNRDASHVHGNCSPIRAIGGHSIDAVVVGGIGMGAINGLNSLGIKVLRAVDGTVELNIQKIKNGELPELTTSHACAGHHGCGH